MAEAERTGAGTADRASRADEAEILALERPSERLLWLYALQSLATLIAAPFVFLPLYFKYHTLRYRLDEEGVSARWGILLRREVYLSYKRIQDIHVKRNVVERWLGIGTVELQTASASSSAELSLEGLERYESVRDFLYRKMRGAADEQREAPAVAPAGEEQALVGLLESLRAELAGARRALEARS